MKAGDAGVETDERGEHQPRLPPRRRGSERRIAAGTVIPPGAAESELLYPEIFQRRRKLEGGCGKFGSPGDQTDSHPLRTAN